MRIVPLILLLPVLALASCSSDSLKDFTLFGYNVGNRARPEIKTVRVPIFRNTTFFRDVEYELTQAVIKRIEDTTPYKVVQGNADAQLLGTIKAGASHVGIQNELNEARSRDFTLIVEVSFVDCRTGQDYFLPVTLQPAMQSAPMPIISNDPLNPAPAVPVTHLKPMIFTKTALYAQELGQSFATARMKVVDEIAVSIVNAMDRPW